jgi:hypothetical protein
LKTTTVVHVEYSKNYAHYSGIFNRIKISRFRMFSRKKRISYDSGVFSNSSSEKTGLLYCLRVAFDFDKYFYLEKKNSRRFYQINLSISTLRLEGYSSIISADNLRRKLTFIKHTIHFPQKMNLRWIYQTINCPMLEFS